MAKRATATKKKTAAKKKTPAKKKNAPAKKKAAAKPVRTAIKGALAGAVAVVTKRLPGGTDAIALLEADHRRLEDLLKRGEETTERAVKGRKALLKTLTQELEAHEMIEEKILYPALKAHPEGLDIVLEGFQEHHVADLIMKELHAVSTSAEEWGAKFKVLKESIEHHIKEEEGPMFRTARGVFSREELLVMAANMRKMKPNR
jgi:hemerythrin-like domain-containing protein